MKKYVVIGSSAAGVNGIRELRKYDKEAEIVLISKDKDIYSRCILHESCTSIWQEREAWSGSALSRRISRRSTG